jgi:hypothetical protein
MFSEQTLIIVALAIASGSAYAGVLDPDCTAEKAARSAAMKATVGVGGRCKPAEPLRIPPGMQWALRRKVRWKSGAMTMARWKSAVTGTE